jgi:hypothetical protein
MQSLRKNPEHPLTMQKAIAKHTHVSNLICVHENELSEIVVKDPSR